LSLIDLHPDATREETCHFFNGICEKRGRQWRRRESCVPDVLWGEIVVHMASLEIPVIAGPLLRDLGG
jgi:hypothetical protein